MLYRVVILSNGRYLKTLHRYKTKATSFKKYHELIEQNKLVKFPKKFINTGKIKPVKYQICVTKPTEPTDVFRELTDRFGNTYTEKPLGDWTILASNEYNFEEKFWIFGRDPKADRPMIDDIVKILFSNFNNKQNIKQIIVVHNKLVIYNEQQFDMVICKCKQDAQRLHHTLAKTMTKLKITNLLFMGTAGPVMISRMYDIIKEQTNWPITKIRRKTTRP